MDSKEKSARTTNAIEVAWLKKGYSWTQILTNIGFSVPKWSVYGLLGANGAWKTTLMKTLCWLIRPDSGEIRVLWKKWDIGSLWKIGALIESPSLYSDNTWIENIQIHALLSAGKKIDPEPLLELVWIDRKAWNRSVSKYSMGMKQRMGIAIALVHDPEVLILDEPTNGLDIEWIREIRDLVHKLSQTYSITIMVSSHQLGEIEKICTHIWVLAKWSMRFDGWIREFLSLGNSAEEAYLNVIK